MDFEKITEKDSNYDALETMSIRALIAGIHQEDQNAVAAVGKVVPEIERLIQQVVAVMQQGGRLFYIGAGTSGRLGVLDASECPPTFGTDPGKVIGLIAGGDTALRTAVENAEDNPEQAWKDLQNYNISTKDIVIGIAASGTTPYVVGGLNACQQQGITTGCICCNHNSPLAKNADFPIEVIVGPEFVTGSSRMKAGTAQKLILNMISTATMIQLGHVKGNKMVDMQLNNNKLHERACRMVVEATKTDLKTAASLLAQHGSVRAAIAAFKKG